jgi:type VI secretion system protein ImpC
MSEQITKDFMPLKVLIIGDFDGANVENSQHIKVSKSNFNDLFSQLTPRLYMRVVNKLTPEPKELNIDLKFTDIDSFRPEAITEQIEIIKDAVKARKAIHELVEKQISPNEAMDILKNSSVANNQIPDLIPVIDEHTSSGKDIDPQVLNSAIVKLDASLSEQFDEILHKPKFQQLESSWRGLKLLLDNADYPDKVQFEILHTEKANLLEQFDEKIFPKEYDDTCEVPLSVMLADFDFTQNASDMNILKKIADKSSILQVVFAASLSPDFFGMKNIAHVVAMPDLASRLVSPTHADWKNFMQSQSARWVSLMINRFLLRDLYGQENQKVDAFNYIEKADATHPDNYLWGRPIWLMGIVLARSYFNVGSCLTISGLGLGGEFGELPIREYPKSRTENILIPVEINMTDEKIWNFIHVGVTPLNATENTKTAYIPLAANSYRSGGTTLHSTLAYHLYIGWIFHQYFRIHQHIPAGSTPDQIAQFTSEKIYEIIKPYGGDKPDETIKITVSPIEGENNLYLVNIHIEPKFQIEQKDVEFTLQLQAQV